MEEFLLELKKKYDVEDFTGNLGVIFSDDNSFENTKEATKAKLESQKFLKDIYNIAIKYL